MVVEYPCVMAERGEGIPGASIWYSFTAHGHTLGVSLEPGRKLVGSTDVDKDTGQITLTLRDTDESRPLHDRYLERTGESTYQVALAITPKI